MEKRGKGAQQEISVASFFGSVLGFFSFWLILKPFCLMTANHTDKNYTMTRWVEHKGARCCLTSKERLFFSLPPTNYASRSGRHRFPSSGSAHIYGSCAPASRGDGQFAQMAAIPSSVNIWLNGERGKDGINVSLRPLSVNAVAEGL